TSTTDIYTLSLHDALPIYADEAAPEWRRGRLLLPEAHPESASRLAGDDPHPVPERQRGRLPGGHRRGRPRVDREPRLHRDAHLRSEEHTSELQSLAYLVCR